ncbi:Copper homeostasis protein cutC [Fibrella aestuarina BUZ 2]|uniref:PF03932 family protein CutC n=1 Tax=Fibrella aestuarina BUZ 2 TaxID=1166018 RepID=I0K5W9_9BACT|nr:copper homeostasis protein CutC [Fibrella aestuarina]CCG99522.1 Copper homeostasis protein cutC [Fibrella aestuarina BUZ 2]
MLIEVCAYSVADCLAAQQAGASRIELCGGRAEGGITPSIGLIRQVRAAVTLPIYVMIRPRGGDFVYTDDELAVMLADIDAAREAGADGLVLGTLLPDGQVDTERTRQLIGQAAGLPITFHRAFDLTRDPHEALDTLIGLGVQTILTSGQQARAIDGIDLLRALAGQATGRIALMAGSGVNAGNARQLAEAGVAALHLSGSVSTDSPMHFRRDGVPMATAVLGEYERVATSERAVRAVVGEVSGR